MIKKRLKILIIPAILLIVLLIFITFKDYGKPTNTPEELSNPIAVNNDAAQSTITAPVISTPTSKIATATNSIELSNPLSSARSRVTKKPFGIKVSPKNSPVSPEIFSGYHTGADFEILPGEENKNVSVSAVCSGPLLLKEYASGYGGVAVQKCELNKEFVTIIYGHLKLSSIKPKTNEEIKAGQEIAILGKGYSSETDGERKHLHLGIHKGSAINIIGYVPTANALKDWLNPLDFLP